jgi:homogentisate 1,2-dioxygenase
LQVENGLDAMSFQGFQLAPENDYIKSRKVLFVNSSLQIGLAAPSASTPYFYKNADADEIIFVHEGSGRLLTMFGELRFQYGDYIVIPRGTVYQVVFDGEDNRWLFMESSDPVFTPKKIPQRIWSAIGTFSFL